MRSIPPLITAAVARKIIGGARKISLDLGLTTSDIYVEGDTANLLDYRVSVKDLEKVAKKENTVFFPENGSLYQVAISSNRFYKLVPTAGAPTIEIDGVRMHRTKKIFPESDAEEKLVVLGLKRGRALDTCMGLGYTAIGALARGAEVVVSIERQAPVVRIAKMNPWSSRLFEEGVSILLGESFQTINALPISFFDWVIHDPPRLTHAGILYSADFYTKLYRVMAEEGRLFHYTGEPGSKYRRVDLQKGVQKRLRMVGFHGIEYHSDIMGITCVK